MTAAATWKLSLPSSVYSCPKHGQVTAFRRAETSTAAEIRRRYADVLEVCWTGASSDTDEREKCDAELYELMSTSLGPSVTAEFLVRYSLYRAIIASCVENRIEGVVTLYVPLIISQCDITGLCISVWGCVRRRTKSQAGQRTENG